jgi:polyhydroxybutyrate depolymerase
MNRFIVKGKYATVGGAAMLGCLMAGMLVPTTASATCTSDTLATGDTTISISFGGSNRSYIVHKPTTASPAAGWPLVIDMHGFTSSASQQKGLSGYQQEADAKNFMAAWPSGLNASWNGYGCCGTSLRNNVNDVGFIKAVANDISNRTRIDASRIYITGLSNGGSMSHRLACEGAEKFAATSPVSFPLNRSSCPSGFPARPITVAHYHGLNDTTVNYNGGGFNNFQSAPNSFAAWQKIDGCTGAVSQVNFTSSDNAKTASGCSGGVTPALISLSGTHVLYNTQSTLNIADHAWTTYLSQFTLPGATGCQ